MCRIAGIVSKSFSDDKENQLLLMRDAMHRGGPDDAGIYIDKQFPIALAHRRLSIIDLSSAGHQPMLSNDQQIIISFNGEIYNYIELRNELKNLGHVFKTETDTEVIIAGYIQWGTAVFAKLNGMFAIDIFDKNTQELILARDHAGIKPLYISLQENEIYFASEIRAFKALHHKFEEQKDWQIYFLLFGSLPEPITTLKGVKPLEKGCFMTVNLNTLKPQITRFNEFKYTSSIHTLSEAEKLVKETLNNAVKRHLIADAPIGLFLSGGIDSSLLTILSEPHLKEQLNTLSIVFDDEKFSEKKYQDIIIEQTGAKHQSFLVSEQNFNDSLPDILNAMDQPTTDGINSYFICKYAKEYGLTAVLSGLGADELFGGYNSFYNHKSVNFSKAIPSFALNLLNHLPKDKYKKLSFLAHKNIIGQYLFNRGFHGINETAKLLDTYTDEVLNCIANLENIYHTKNLSDFNNASYLETNIYMQNQLLKDTDCMSMWHAVEVRVPFLDKELMQLVYSIDSNIKFNAKQKKFLLVDTFKNVLPKAIWDRPKQGFTFPFENWMKNIHPLTNKKMNNYAENQFKKGNYSWSRYWAYLLTQNLN